MSGGHILVVDDEPHILDLYKDELEADGYRVTISDGSCNIAALVAEIKPDVVVLDIRLGPNRSGLDILQEIKRLYPETPVILATAHAAFQHDIKAVAANHYVIKSTTMTDLKAKIIECLR